MASATPQRTPPSLDPDRPARASRTLQPILGSPFSHAVALQRALDVGFIGTLVAVIFRLADSDMLFHIVFVLLSVEAFAFNLRTAAPRIGFAFAAVIIDVVAPDGLSPTDFYTEWPLMFLLAAIVAIMAARRREVVQQYAGLYREASERVLTTQEDERRQLSLDLHDGVGQTLTALALTVDAASASIAPDAPAQRALERARQLAAEAIAETRDVAEQLRPTRLREQGLVSAVGELAGRAGLPVEVEVDAGLGRLDGLDTAQTMTIFRIVQEALANAARHSGATRARVAFHRSGPDLRIDVEDDGRGFEAAAGHARGLGLAGMRERALILGARLAIDSAPGTGTRVRLVVPGAARLPLAGGQISHISPGHAGFVAGSVTPVQADAAERQSPVWLDRGGAGSAS